MHRHPGTAALQTGAFGDTDSHFAAGIGDADQIAAFQISVAHVARMHGEQRFVLKIEQARHRAGAAHAVPVIAHAARQQADGCIRSQHIGSRQVLDGDEARPTIGSRKTAVLVETDLAGASAFRIWPLLRPLRFEQRIAQAGDIEIAAAGTLAMLVEDGFGIDIGKQ